MLHRIRDCCNNKQDQLSNVVAVYETFIGGKNIRNSQGGKGKSVVLCMVEKCGKLISYVVVDKKTKSLLPHIKENIKDNSDLMKDELFSYNS